MLRLHERVLPPPGWERRSLKTQLDPRSIVIAERTDVGMLRESNQDTCGHANVFASGRLLFVADGMGGHAGGERASELALESVVRAFGPDAGPPERALHGALAAANRCILEEARRNPELRGMGTTGVALLFVPEGVCVANVGDSRAYRLREGALARLTHDHSLVAELMRRGALSEEQARVHPRRNELLRCLGVDEEVEIDVESLDVARGDTYVLCSDGLCGVLRDEEIRDVLRESSPAEAVERLVNAANERGGPDNITVQVALVP